MRAVIEELQLNLTVKEFFSKLRDDPANFFGWDLRFQRAWQYIVDIQVWRGSLFSIQHNNQWPNLGKTSDAVQKDTQPEAWTSWGIGKKKTRAAKKPQNETHIFQNPEASAASYIAGKVLKLLHHNRGDKTPYRWMMQWVKILDVGTEDGSRPGRFYVNTAKYVLQSF